MIVQFEAAPPQALQPPVNLNTRQLGIDQKAAFQAPYQTRYGAAVHSHLFEAMNQYLAVNLVDSMVLLYCAASIPVCLAAILLHSAVKSSPCILPLAKLHSLQQGTLLLSV